VGLVGLAKLHKRMVNEELEHVRKIMKVMTVRGGNLCFEPEPTDNHWSSPLEAMQAALKTEKKALLVRTLGILPKNIALLEKNHQFFKLLSWNESFVTSIHRLIVVVVVVERQGGILPQT